jgi:nickel transport protein
VRIVDPSGHGLDTTVDVASPVAADTAAHPSAFSFSGPLAFILRPALGVVLVAAIFGFLFQRGRRKTS